MKYYCKNMYEADSFVNNTSCHWAYLCRPECGDVWRWHRRASVYIGQEFVIPMEILVKRLMKFGRDK